MSSQLQVTGEAKIRDIQGPVVANSGVVTALDGDASQYVRGDGTLADFPTSTGGGSSVSYYLNSSVSQGTIGGVAYRQLGKTPVAGAGTDITTSTNGYVASYLTDANDPALLEVPAGNFNCEFYFSVNSDAHNPFVYAEVYKYDGTTFTLIGSSQSVPEYLTNGTTLSPYYFAIPVTQTILSITDRIAIRIYVNVDGRTVTLHTENNHLCQVVTTFSKGLTSLNNLTRQVQFLGTGTSGTDFNISSSTATHTFNLPVASAANTGKLSSTDWSTFNNKQNAITLTTTGISGVATLVGATLNIPDYTTDLSGYLPLTGGTLTGALNGTTASFTGSLTAQRGNFNQGAASGYAISMQNRNANQEWGLIVDTDAVDDKNLGLYSSEAAMYILRIAASTGAATFFSRITSNNSIVVNRVDNGDYLALKIENRPITAGNTASGFIAFYSNSGDATNDTYSSGRIYSRFDTNSYNSARISLATVTGNEIYQDVLTAKDTNVGIGTINPAQTLHLFTTSATGSGVGTAIQIQSAGTGADQGWIGVNKGTGNGLTLSVQTNNIIFNTGASTPFGGTERMRVTNGGDVGIATVNPSAKLDVNGTGNFSGALSGTTATFSSSVTANSLIKTGGTSAQILAADGSVITAGTNITISGGTISSSGAITGSGTTNYVTKFTGASSIGNSLIFDNGTNIGIGLTSPSYKLDVQDNGVSGIVDVASFSVTGNGGSGRGIGILLGAAGSSSSVQVARLVGYHELANPVAVASSFAIQVANSSGVLTERLRISQAGNLIIGTTGDAGFKLNVNGTGNFTGALTGINATFNGSGFGSNGLTATGANGGHGVQGTGGGSGGRGVFGTSNDVSGFGGYFSHTASGTALYVSGAATFSSSVTAGAITSSVATGNGSFYINNASLTNKNWTLIPSTSGAETDLLFFYTGTSAGTRMTITNGGNVGIGTSSPGATLEVRPGSGSNFRVRANGTNNLLLQNYNDSDYYRNMQLAASTIQFFTGTEGGDSASERMRISSVGDLLVGKTSNSATVEGFMVYNTNTADGQVFSSIPTAANTYHVYDVNVGAFRFYVSGGGTIFATNTTISSLSDERLKENIQDLDLGLDSIMALRPRKYDWKAESGNNGKNVRGFIAQEVEAIFPDLIDEWKKEPKDENAISYKSLRQDFIPILVKATQELKIEKDTEIAELKAQIEELKELIKNK